MALKKIIVSLVFVGLSGLYVFYRPQIATTTITTSDTITPSVPSITPTIRIRGGEDSGEDGGSITITPVQTPAPKPAPTPTPPPVVVPPKTGFKDGVFTGSVADAFYGLVQVKATIVNGKITDVAFLQYPSDRSTSRYINSQAMPMLTQEAIQAQSANVNTISGATATSGAFQESLAVALASAKY